jgi:hypothetical protein
MAYAQRHLPKLKAISPEQITRTLVEQIVDADKLIADGSWWETTTTRGCTLLAARACVDSAQALLVIFRMTLRPQAPGRYEFGLHLGPERIFGIDVGREHRPCGLVHEHQWLGLGNRNRTAPALYITHPDDHRRSFTQALARLNIKYEDGYPFDKILHQRLLEERGLSDELRDFGRRDS